MSHGQGSGDAEMHRTTSISHTLMIPGIGRFFVIYDRLRLVSTTTPRALRKALKEAGFERWVHQFKVEKLERLSRHYRSKLEFTPVHGAAAFEWLRDNEGVLGSYNFTRVEIACDSPATTITMLRERTIRLIKAIAKPRATRGHLIAARRGAKKRWETPDPGRPTFYVEDRPSAVGLKFYERFAKTTGRRVSGEMLTRMELTIRRSEQISKKLGGSRVNDLLKADLPNVVRKQLRLARVDHPKVGKLIKTKMGGEVLGGHDRPCRPIPRGYASEDDYRATRRAVTYLTGHAAKNGQRLNGWEDALLISEHSPIEVRGILKKLQAKNPAITDYQIDRCFQPVPWRKRVRL